MVWAGVDSGGDSLARLHGLLGEQLERAGMPAGDDRPFRGHVTLCRVKKLRDAAGFRAALQRWHERPFGYVECRHVAVFSSELTPRGPQYARLHAAPLEIR